MILAILIAWHAYKKATAAGRNGVLWALAGAGVFIGTQLIIQFGIGVLMGLGMAAFDWPESIFENYTWPITIVAVIVSFGTSWLLLRYLDRPIEIEEDPYSPPPPPPTFGENAP